MLTPTLQTIYPFDFIKAFLNNDLFFLAATPLSQELS